MTHTVIIILRMLIILHQVRRLTGFKGFEDLLVTVFLLILLL